MTELGDFLHLTQHHPTAAARGRLAREQREGRLVRVCEGAYVPSEHWHGLDDRQRHLTLAHATQRVRRRRLVFSHWTAAAAWNLPFIDPFPTSAHVVAPRASGGRSDDRVVRHCVDIPDDTEWVESLEVTTIRRTVTDLARVATFASAVVFADAALAREGPAAAFEPVSPGGRGAARARQVLSFADGRSGSPGESLSRVGIAASGLPAPELQHRFDDAAGSMFVDFWWPQFNLVGEFDGAVKYDDPHFLAGRTPQQALLDEKDREDRIRALGPRVSRWRWPLARNPGRLRAHLLAAGLRDVRYRKW